MKLYSYVVARDYAFAPNPFFDVCTLATCKPTIRKLARVGDWVIGTGSANYKLTGHLIFAMQVTETLPFDAYWTDLRFAVKKPNLSGSLKQAFGDNIYRRVGKTWYQVDSHHSLEDGSPNPSNIDHDTQVNRLLLSSRYVYFGSKAPPIPDELRDHDGEDVCAVRGHKVHFSDAMVKRCVSWIEGIGLTGQAGKPSEWLIRGALRKV